MRNLRRGQFNSYSDTQITGFAFIYTMYRGPWVPWLFKMHDLSIGFQARGRLVCIVDHWLERVEGVEELSERMNQEAI